MSTLENKHIVIAGGASGIGKALVEKLVAAHARVTVTGRNADKLNALKAALPAVNTAVVDSTDRAALDAFFQQLGSVDHLVLSVSGNRGMGDFRTLDLSEVRAGFEQKFFPHLDTLQAALPYLKESATFISAISAQARLAGTSGLAAINGSLELMVPILAKELKPLRINSVSPGVIDTPWWDAVPADQKAGAFEHFASLTYVGRVGAAEEVASVLLTIIANGYINGAVIPVSGGM